MLRVPKQIYFDQDLLLFYEKRAKEEGKSFSAVVREKLESHIPEIKKFLSTHSKKQLSRKK